MSRDTAKAFYTKQPGDPDTGYISSTDAQAAIDVMYDDMAIGDVPPDGSITTAKLADAAVSGAKILDGAVSAEKITIGAATIGYGTTNPNGTRAAPIGSSYLQTSGAATVSGQLLYRKTSGTGSTGWTPEGALADTGRRLVTADVTNAWAATAVYLRRIGNTCTMWGSGLDKTSATADGFYTLSAGFLPAHSSSWFGSGVDYSTDDYVPIFIYSTSGVRAVRSKITSTDVRFTLSWITDQTWPSSLPGSAAYPPH